MCPKILIVEDDFISSDVMKDRLGSLGYSTIETAFNGKDAIQRAADFHPDLIVMDINLGDGIDGIEAAARILETNAIPVIYLTAYDDEAILKRAKITGPYAYVLKPFDERELHIAIEIALYKHQAEQRVQQALHESQKREQEIAELLDATHAVLEVGEFQATARYVFDACKRAIGAKAGYVALLNPDGKNNDLLFLDDGGLPCAVDPDLPMPVRGLRAEAYRNGKVVYDNNFMQSEWAHFMPEGHVTLSNVLFAPLNIDGKTVGVLGLSNKDGDFSEHDARLAAAFGDYAAIALRNSKTFEMLHTQNAQLQELNATKDTFFSIIAHDLRGPFTGMMTGAELLKKQLQTSEDTLMVTLSDELQMTTRNVYSLLENLLIWAHSQQGRISYEFQNVDLTFAVEHCTQLLQEHADRKQITIINTVEKDTIVYADFNMLCTIFRNLLSNAIKFTPQAGAITIAARKNAEMIEAMVKDTGTGISARKLERLFKVGEKNISNQGTDGEKGTGLGLILCREFVEKHGGRIWAESQQGAGSSFRFTLPMGLH